ESREEWLVDGEGPSLRCDQLSAYEYQQIQEALNDVSQNGGKYSGNGQGSIYRYADTVGVSRGSGFSGGGGSGGDIVSSDDSGGGDVSDSGDNSDNSGNDNN